MANIYQPGLQNTNKNRLFSAIYPAFAGRCVQRGLRQSM